MYQTSRRFSIQNVIIIVLDMPKTTRRMGRLVRAPLPVRSNIILTIISSEKNIQLNLNRNRNLNIDCLQSYWLFVDSSIYRINFYTAKSRAVPNMSGLWKPLFCLFRADQNHWMYVISFWLCLLLSLLMLFFMYLKTCLTIFQVSVLRAHE